MKPLPIFIGYDGKESLAYHVFAHSILRRASIPVAFTPVIQSTLRQRELYWRDADTKAATEFSLTRFLAPHLQGYRGLAIFADCDMLMRADVAELVEIVEHERLLHGDGPAVLACQHDYQPRSATKMGGIPQAAYPKKNWSSFMVLDCAKCVSLSPRYVSVAQPSDLHRFNWLGQTPQHGHVASLPLEWNWLVGEYEPNLTAKNLHFTLGGPWLPGYEDCDHAQDWRDEFDAMTGVGV